MCLLLGLRKNGCFCLQMQQKLTQFEVEIKRIQFQICNIRAHKKDQVGIWLPSNMQLLFCQEAASAQTNYINQVANQIQFSNKIMIQNNNNFLKRLDSFDSNSTVAMDSQGQLLKKAKTMPQNMMDEFLARQQIYDKINKPILKLEYERFNPQRSQPSKLSDVVHEARKTFTENKAKKERQLDAKQREKLGLVIKRMRRLNFVKQNTTINSQNIQPQQLQINKIQIILIISVVLAFMYLIRITF